MNTPKTPEGAPHVVDALDRYGAVAAAVELERAAAGITSALADAGLSGRVVDGCAAYLTARATELRTATEVRRT